MVGKIKISGKFKPDPSQKTVYFIYLVMTVSIPIIVTIIPILAVPVFSPQVWQAAWFFICLPSSSP